jgi:hypothetical protein
MVLCKSVKKTSAVCGAINANKTNTKIDKEER